MNTLAGAWRLFLGILLTLTVAGCKDELTEPQPAASVEVTLSNVRVIVGHTTQATVSVRDRNGKPLTGRSVTWSTSDVALATVSQTGLVTAVDVGVASVTAEVDGKSGSASVTVVPVPVAVLRLSLDSATIIVGRTLQLGATTSDSAGNTLEGRPVAWTSQDPSVGAP